MKTLEITNFGTRPTVNPCLDSDELAAIGRRVMVRRNTSSGQYSLFVAEKGVLTAGWVLSVEKP
jgi:hypothetical protein